MTDESTDIGLGSAPAHGTSVVSLRDVLMPVARRWKLLALMATVAASLAITIIAIRGPRYEARLIVATVSSQPGLNLGGAAALLASAGGAAPAQAGLQVSPLLIADLMQSRRVLLSVGLATLPGQTQRIVDLVAEKPVRSDKVVEEMDDVIFARVAKETGLVSLGVVLADSGLAREIARRVVAEVTHAYVETARAQASQLRRAQDVRVDSARRGLARLEREQQLFQQSNRVVLSFSELAIRQQALQREVGVAEQVYSKAVSDRESAIAKELEETPVVVTIDPVPETLPPTPRRLVLFTGLAIIAALGMGILWIFVSESLRAPPAPDRLGAPSLDVTSVHSRTRGRAGA